MSTCIPLTRNTADIEAIKDELKKLKHGETVSYAALSQCVGRDLQRKHRYLLVAATNQLLKKNNMAFGSVTNFGIKRMTSDECVLHSKHALRGIKGMAKRAAQRIASADYQTLSSDDLRRLHNGALSIFAAIAYSADSSNLNRLSAPCSNSQPAIMPTARVLSLLAS